MSPKKIFLLNGAITSAVWLTMNYVRGEGLSDWWLIILAAFVGSAIAAVLLGNMTSGNDPP
jgi:ABC-type branched-subunit amino acid transport system permease subunit